MTNLDKVNEKILDVRRVLTDLRAELTDLLYKFATTGSEEAWADAREINDKVEGCLMFLKARELLQNKAKQEDMVADKPEPVKDPWVVRYEELTDLISNADSFAGIEKNVMEFRKTAATIYKRQDAEAIIDAARARLNG